MPGRSRQDKWPCVRPTSKPALFSQLCGLSIDPGVHLSPGTRRDWWTTRERYVPRQTFLHSLSLSVHLLCLSFSFFFFWSLHFVIFEDDASWRFNCPILMSFGSLCWTWLRICGNRWNTWSISKIGWLMWLSGFVFRKIQAWLMVEIRNCFVVRYIYSVWQNIRRYGARVFEGVASPKFPGTIPRASIAHFEEPLPVGPW